MTGQIPASVKISAITNPVANVVFEFFNDKGEVIPPHELGPFNWTDFERSPSLDDLRAERASLIARIEPGQSGVSELRHRLKDVTERIMRLEAYL